VHQALEQRHLAVVLVLRRTENDAQVLLVQRLGRPGEDGREIDGVHLRHRDADEAGAAGGEPAGAPVGGVAALADDPLDELAGLVGNVFAAVDDAGDGRDRHAREVGDLADRHARGAAVGAVRVLAHGSHSSTFRNVSEGVRSFRGMKPGPPCEYAG